jgi:IclR family acetate operon transcriptional repressor
MPAYTSNTITSADKLHKELEKIRMQGYSVDGEEYEIGIRAVSVAIRNQLGNIIASVSVPGPTSRMTAERLPQIADALMESARSISRRMGWNM